MRTPCVSLRMAVARRASSFRQQHFQAGGEASGLETEGLQKLRQLCSQLGQDDDSCVAELLEVRCLVVFRVVAAVEYAFWFGIILQRIQY